MFQREVSVFDVDVDVDVGMNNNNVDHLGDRQQQQQQQQQQQRFLQEMTFRRNCSVCHFNTGKIEDLKLGSQY